MKRLEIYIPNALFSDPEEFETSGNKHSLGLPILSIKLCVSENVCKMFTMLSKQTMFTMLSKLKNVHNVEQTEQARKARDAIAISETINHSLTYRVGARRCYHI